MPMDTWGGGAPHPTQDGGFTHHFLQQARPSLDSGDHNQSLPCCLHSSHTSLRMHTRVHLALRATALQIPGEPTPSPPPSLLCDKHPHSSAVPRAVSSPFPFKGVAPISLLNNDPHDHTRRTMCGQPRASAQPLCSAHPGLFLSAHPRPLSSLPTTAYVPSAHRGLCHLCPAGSHITCCLSSKSPGLSCGCPDPVHLLASR